MMNNTTEPLLNYIWLRFGSISETLENLEQRVGRLEDILAAQLADRQTRERTRLDAAGKSMVLEAKAVRS
jgi:hypothetical protein